MTQGNGHGNAPRVLCILPITISMIVSVLVCASPSVCNIHLLFLLLQPVKSKDLDRAKRCAASYLRQQAPVLSPALGLHHWLQPDCAAWPRATDGTAAQVMVRAVTVELLDPVVHVPRKAATAQATHYLILIAGNHRAPQGHLGE